MSVNRFRDINKNKILHSLKIQKARPLLQALLLLACTIVLLNFCSKIKPESLPTFHINTQQQILDEPKVLGTLTVKNSSLTRMLQVMNIAIELRGASSQVSYPKKSYGFKILDSRLNDIKKSLLGLPPGNGWVLYGPYADKTYLRNVLTYRLAREIGIHASRSRFIELWINGHFHGVYILLEKIERSRWKVPIDRKSLSNQMKLSANFILKIDRLPKGEYYNKTNSFPSKNRKILNLFDEPLHFQYVYPKAKKIFRVQKRAIRQFIHEFENLMNPPIQWSRLSKVANMKSFVDFFLINELAKNIDAYRLSTYFYKSTRGKLNMGPIWDFNLSYGNKKMCNFDSYKGWSADFNVSCPNDYWLVPFWWNALLSNKEFQKKTKVRWMELRKTTFNFNHIEKVMTFYSNKITKSGLRTKDYLLWNPKEDNTSSQEEEIQKLKGWLKKRLAWMDKKIQNFP